MRRDGFTNGATYEEIIEMSVKSKNTQYDILASDEKYEADKFHILHEFYSEHNNGKEIAEKALRSMGFYDENGFLANGAVLFQDGYASIFFLPSFFLSLNDSFAVKQILSYI